MKFYTNISMDAPTEFNNTHTKVKMTIDSNLNEIIMPKTAISQPMFSGILLEKVCAEKLGSHREQNRYSAFM